MNLKEKFRKNPSFYYSMSIAATWAGAGSFIVGTKVAQTAGFIPWLLWALGNTLSCIIFGVIATKFKAVRDMANSKPFKLLMGFIAIFQIWLNMTGIYEMLEPTIIGKYASYVIVYALAIFFLILYMKKATYRNVMTDNGSWFLVYGLIFLLVIISLVCNGFKGIPLLTDPAEIKSKGWTMITLMFGGCLFPTFCELLDYNDNNEDEANKVDMRKAFINGGLMFGFYLLFVLLGSCTTYIPALDLVKAILISLVAISSLSSFIYAITIDFGKKVGTCLNVAVIASWAILVPMGIMFIWDTMQNTRIWMIWGMFALAGAKSLYDRNKGKESANAGTEEV